jgi:hypothetical protein
MKLSTELLIMSMGWDVSEPWPPTSLLFIHLVICESGGPWWWWWSCHLEKAPDSSTRALWQQQRNLGASSRNGKRSENFAYQYLRYVNGFLTCCKILRHGTSGFTFHPKEVCALKNPSPLPGLNPRPLGPLASTLTTTPPRRQNCV